MLPQPKWECASVCVQVKRDVWGPAKQPESDGSVRPTGYALTRRYSRATLERVRISTHTRNEKFLDDKPE